MNSLFKSFTVPWSDITDSVGAGASLVVLSFLSKGRGFDFNTNDKCLLIEGIAVLFRFSLSPCCCECLCANAGASFVGA